MADPNDLVTKPYARFLNDTLEQLASEECDSILIMAISDGRTLLSRYHVAMSDYYIYQGLVQSEMMRMTMRLVEEEKSQDDEEYDDDEEEPEDE